MTPSCQIEVDVAGIDPGAVPPTSEWCARVQAKATIRPSSASGVTIVMSGRCDPPAKGSLRIQVSPG